MTLDEIRMFLPFAVKWYAFGMFISATLFGAVVIIERGEGKGGWGYRYRRWNLHFTIATVAIVSIVRRSVASSLQTLLHSN